MSAPSYPQITDQTILGWVQDALLEPNNGGASLATVQFSVQQLINSANQSSWNLQRDTGCVSWHLGFNGDSLTGTNVTPGQEQVPLPQDSIDIRRLAWIGFDTSIPTPEPNSITELPRQDSFSLDANSPSWEATLGQPTTFDESLPPIPSVNISDQPSDIGQLDVLYTPVPTQLSNTGVALSFPPDCAVGVFYGAMDLLFSLQGEGADDQRARWCRQLYQLNVALIKSLQFMTLMVPVQGGG